MATHEVSSKSETPEAQNQALNLQVNSKGPPKWRISTNIYKGGFQLQKLHGCANEWLENEWLEREWHIMDDWDI